MLCCVALRYHCNRQKILYGFTTQLDMVLYVGSDSELGHVSPETRYGLAHCTVNLHAPFTVILGKGQSSGAHI